MQVIELAKKYAKSPAQIILCHTICRGISVVPKTNNPARLSKNFQVLFDFDDEDFLKMDILMGIRGENGVRNLEMTEYLRFDNFNEETEEP